MPMKNLLVWRPLWSSTQKFRRLQDSRSMLAIPVDGGKGAARCSSGIERERESEREIESGEGGGKEGGGGGRRETAVPTRRYEGMDLDLKGGTTWKEGVEGSEVGWAISEPSVAQWLTGAIQPTASDFPLPPSPSSTSPISSLRPPTVSVYVYSYALLSWQEKPTRVTPN